MTLTEPAVAALNGTLRAISQLARPGRSRDSGLGSAEVSADSTDIIVAASLCLNARARALSPTSAAATGLASIWAPTPTSAPPLLPRRTARLNRCPLPDGVPLANGDRKRCPGERSSNEDPVRASPS